MLVLKHWQTYSFPQKSKLVPSQFISHSKLYNDKNVLGYQNKVKQIHDAECNVIFWLCFLYLVHFQYF